MSPVTHEEGRVHRGKTPCRFSFNNRFRVFAQDRFAASSAALRRARASEPMNRSASGSLPTNGELPVLNSTCERRWDISMQRTHLDRL